jgi:Kef-type K+ transport system membrane component KefB
VLGTFSSAVVGTLRPVSSLAIALIAFLAGAELQWAEIRARGVTIVKILSAELLLCFVGLVATLYLLHGWMPMLADASSREVVAFAVLFAAVAIVHSPAVTMALLSETGARGNVARTTLGVVLVADVAVILFFSGALAVARALVAPAGGGSLSVGLVAWELGGAVLVGALLGGAVALYLRRVRGELFVFALVIAFFGAEIARLAHVETLLTLLVAGFVAENASAGQGDALRHAMERAAAPVFVVFFALAGADIRLAGVAELWRLVIPLVLVRALAIYAGCALGARWAGASAGEGRYVWMGLISQAGVAIGLAAVVAEAYPQRGEQLRTLFLATLTINQTLGPVLFRQALARSGELRGAAAPVARPAAEHA